MKKHEAIRQLVAAEHELAQARELCATPRVIELLDMARNRIMVAGDSLWPDIIDEVRRQKTDAMM